MNNLIRKILIIFATLCYAFPLNAAESVLNGSIDSVACESSCVECPDSEDGCCENGCEAHCASCCSLVVFSTSNDIELSTLDANLDTIYNPHLSSAHLDGLIRPPIK